MRLLEILLEALALIAGGIGIAAAVTYGTWQAFKLINHPEWGPATAFAGMLFAFVWTHSKSDLEAMVLTFTCVASLAAWPEGTRWRGRKKLDRLFGVLHHRNWPK